MGIATIPVERNWTKSIKYCLNVLIDYGQLQTNCCLRCTYAGCTQRPSVSDPRMILAAGLGSLGIALDDLYIRL